MEPDVAQPFKLAELNHFNEVFVGGLPIRIHTYRLVTVFLGCSPNAFMKNARGHFFRSDVFVARSVHVSPSVLA